MHRLLILLWFVHEKCKNNHSYHSFNVKKPRKKRFNSAFASWNKTWHHWTLHALYWVIPLTSFEFVASGVDLAHAHYTGISCSYMSLHVFFTTRRYSGYSHLCRFMWELDVIPWPAWPAWCRIPDIGIHFCFVRRDHLCSAVRCCSKFAEPFQNRKVRFPRWPGRTW